LKKSSSGNSDFETAPVILTEGEVSALTVIIDGLLEAIYTAMSQIFQLMSPTKKVNQNISLCFRTILVDKGVEELPPPKVLNGAELAAKELMSFKSIDQVGTYQFIN
jgi:hypothetical protein